jgi:hypothetical protein
MAILAGIFLYSCSKTETIPPEAEILEITDITDTSACFKVVVTSWSNAQYGEYIRIWIDTLKITLFESPIYSEAFYPSVLDGINIVDIGGLFPNTHYFSRIYYEGLFDIGGTTETKYFLLGEQKEFTTLP